LNIIVRYSQHSKSCTCDAQRHGGLMGDSENKVV